MITNNIAFDFERITSYLRDYSGKKYEDPKKAGNRMNEMEKFKEAGKKAREEFIAYANYIAESLDYKAGKCSGWIYQSQIACTYFWIELKKNEALKLPHSISISINIHPEHDINGPITLSFKVEAKDNACEDLDYKIHNKIIDVPIKKDSKIYYQTDLLNGTCRRFDNNTIELEKIKKLKVVRDIIGPYEKSNASKIIKDSIEAAKELVPFYEYILSERELRLSKNVEEEMKGIKPELNTILYGPPGTGKTYNTVIYAVAICENKNIEDVQSEEYEKVLYRYNELKKEGRIAFTTFHQSFGYEEFIEGISPIIFEDNSDDCSGNIEYKIKSGIFKSFCEETEKITIKNDKFSINKDATIWKVTVGSKVQNDCFVNNYIRIGFGINDKGAKEFVNQINEGDIIITTDGNRKNIRGIAIATSDEAYKLENTESDSTTRDVMWLVRDINDDVTILNGNKWLQRKTVSRLPNMNIKDLMEFAIKKNVELKETHIEKNNGSYVFIIDEINRGNISKIFGELITLIEDTKRKGMTEEMSTILPYSGSLFSVPSNVYILGTMNTADRSIALMDTALRRRFQFVEMMPNTDILKNVTVDGVEIAPILEKINERITFLYDREHTIGHAFFIKLIDSPEINTLGSIFEKSIIPLLQEYFYEDYQKIQLVLGDNGKSDPSTRFILDEVIKVKSVFKGEATDVIDLPEKKYTINKEAFLNIESYKQIL
jgi:ATPase associated with various cellular activities AAA_5